MIRSCCNVILFVFQEISRFLVEICGANVNQVITWTVPEPDDSILTLVMKDVTFSNLEPIPFLLTELRHDPNLVLYQSDRSSPFTALFKAIEFDMKR
jgi:hypothetical protein